MVDLGNSDSATGSERTVTKAMIVKGSKGMKNRNFPGLTLEQALAIPRAIQDQAAGKPVTRVTLADLVGRTPGPSMLVELVIASRFYGLTTGGANADQFALTELGDRATGADEVSQQAAYREAVMTVPPYSTFLTAHNNKRIPASGPSKDFLVGQAGVPPERAEECMGFLLTDARFVGFLKVVKGGSEWVELNETHVVSPVNGSSHPAIQDATSLDHDLGLSSGEYPLAERSLTGNGHHPASPPDKPLTKPNKVFIAHGKNREPLEQLKKMLDRFKVPYAVAIDEPHAGRPISAKVASLMRDCSAGIFIFTADERFFQEGKDGEMKELYRPSENVVYELGAASVLYDQRIVLFKEEGVTFPSDYSDLGHISFKADQLGDRMGALLDELVGLDLLEVRVKV